MTSRIKLTIGLCVVASSALFTGICTFSQWSGFVLHLALPTP